jgi:ribosome-associated protein
MKIEKKTEKNANQLVSSIVEGIQEKKGHHISVADLSAIDDTICQYLVICDANSPSHISAIYESVRETAQKHTGEKPNAVDGLRNSIWVAMDYADVIVHIFLPETRQFYDIDHLWEDADVELIPDVDA